MSNEITLKTRREFLRASILGGALSWTVPAFLANTFSAMHAQAEDSATQIATGRDSNILVVLQMAGGNDGLKLQIAMSYGGRWDIVQAAQELARQCSSGSIRVADIDETRFAAQLQLADLPETDLMIRTGGEQRISNFLLWHAAYAELYFSPVLWPEFDVAELEASLAFFTSRERRFGLTQEQLPGRAGGEAMKVREP